MIITPTNAYHYFGIATENPSAPGTAVPVQKFGAYKTFNDGAVINNEPDEGHVGARSITLSNDRVSASSEPEINDRLRPDDEFGYFLYHLLGADDVTQNIPSTGLSYKHKFTESQIGLPTATIYQGYNYDADTAKSMAGCVCDSLSFNFNPAQAPTVTAKYKGDFPVFGVTEPTLSYSTTPSFKAGQMAVYLDDYATGTIGATAMTGFKEASVTLTNQVTIDPKVGGTLGQNNKDVGNLTISGTYTRKYTADDEDYQRFWATGAFDGTTPSTEGVFKKARFAYTGPMIETSYPYLFQLDILKMEITDVKPTQDGEGAKTFAHTFEGVVDTSTGTSVEMVLQNKIASYEYIAPP